MADWSKWKPRRVQCTNSANHTGLPGETYVVKYAAGSSGCACAISELVCTQLLSELGICTLNPFIVEVSTSFAASCNSKLNLQYPIIPGPHFGTLLDRDVANGPPIALNDLARPFDLVLLWVADTWIGNIDRGVEGNTLLKPAGSGRFHLLASDQSDCFCGASQFCGASFPDVFLDVGKSPAPKVLASAIYSTGGSTALMDAIGRVQQMTSQVPSILSTVPQAWWSGSKIEPTNLVNALHVRADQLTKLIDPAFWGVTDGFLI
jgi:hypothetical protein